MAKNRPTNQNNRPKVLILVLCHGGGPWRKIEDTAQKKFFQIFFGGSSQVVWINGLSDGVGDGISHPSVSLLRRQMKLTSSPKRTYFRNALRAYVSVFHPKGLGVRKAREFFYGRFPGFETTVVGSRVTIPYPIQIHIAGFRGIETFRYALDHFDFDYLVRISSTCLVRPEPLFEFLASLPRKKVFAGRSVSFGLSTFASGAALVFSRDVVEGVVVNARNLAMSVYEDVALSFLIRSKRLADFYDLGVSNIRKPSDLPNDIEGWAGVPIIRCKAEEPTLSSQPVIANMEAVTQFLQARRAENSPELPKLPS